MAQSGYTPILIYASSTASAQPTAGNLTSSANGAELALNYTDGKLYYKDNAGAVQVIGVKLPSSTLPVANGGTGATTLTANNVILGNGTSAVQFVAPGANGNVLTSNGTTWYSAAVAASLLGQTDSATPFETALGYQAGNANTGVNNTFIGYQAGLLNSTGTNNVAIGFKALDANTTSGSSVAIGSNALGSSTSGENTAVGYNALLSNTTGNANTAIGTEAVRSNLTGTSNTAVGYASLYQNTGDSNVAVGRQALFSNTSGALNSAFGSYALYSNTTSSYSTAIGSQALYYNTGGFNTALGANSLFSNTTASNNVAVGYNALYANTASDNTAIGYGALDANTTGNRNVAIGVDAFGANVSGAQNVHIGWRANSSATTGNGQTMVGYEPGLNTTGNNNTFIGYQAGSSVTTGTNNLILGYGADASSATVSNEVTIGNTSITSTRLRGMVQLNAAMFEQATVSATAATGTINFDARTQSVLYYTSNASANWTLNVRGASGVSLDSVMSTGQSLTIAFLVTNGATAYYQSAFQVDSVSVTPKWQGGTAPTSGNASSVDIYAITIVKTGSATFTAFASQTKFA